MTTMERKKYVDVPSIVHHFLSSYECSKEDTGPAIRFYQSGKSFRLTLVMFPDQPESPCQTDLSHAKVMEMAWEDADMPRNKSQMSHCCRFTDANGVHSGHGFSEEEVSLVEKKIELKENLIVELEEKKKSIESERTTMELTGDSMEVKPVMTRKLRRRPNDPIPLPEKRRKPSPAQLNYFLEECEILEDLKIINKISGRPINRKPTSPPSPSEGLSMEVKIEDGRLYYEKRWFHRGQPVYVESKEMGKMSAIISTIGTQELWVKKSDNTKLRIYLSQLQKGKYILRRRSM